MVEWAGGVILAARRQHHPESPAHRLQRGVAPRLPAELGEAQGALVQRHARIQIGDLQLEVREPFEG